MDNLYIRIPTVNGLWQGWLVTEPHSSAQVLSQHELEAIMATKAMNMRITLLLPTSSCVIAAINVTRQQLKQLSATDIAYLLEDQTLTAVEQLHCVYEPLNEQQALVLGIQDNVLKELLEPFKDIAGELVAVVPDIFLLPPNSQGWSLLVDNSDCWLRLNNTWGVRLEANAALALLDSAWNEFPTSHIQIYGEIPTDVQVWLAAQENITIEHLAVLDWTQQFSQITAKHPFNVLKGEFAVKTKSSLSGYWRYAVIFVAICFVTQLAYDAARLMHYQRVIKSVKTQNIELYKSLFPEEQRIVNLRRQIESHLLEKQDAGQGFVPIATRVGEVLNAGNWQTQRIDFDNNGLLLEVDTLSLSDLEQLRQQLTSQGLLSETLSANSQGTGIRGRLRISENS
jgi:general secretion pathway protein L